MQHTSFLAQVAQYYASSSQLGSMAFVLPNRRSSQQFEHQLMQLLDHATIMPRVMSMNDFIDHVTSDSGLVSATPIESLFVLYQAYCHVMGDAAGEFDKFAYWAQLIVTDFNDIDQNLVDAHELYRNLSELRDIAADYIDDDLKVAIRRIFDINIKDGEDKFWKKPVAPTDATPDDDVQRSYITLWNSLGAIYDEYDLRLREFMLTTPGKLYRLAEKNISEMSAEQLGYSRIVMVGHDMLTMSEARIFSHLSKKGVADFWWDTASPAFGHDNNPAHNVIHTFSKLFPSPVPIEPIDSFPHITVQEIPSVVGMAKCAFEDINRATSDVGIVVPDEALLEPLINSLPDKLLNAQAGKSPSECINITMSYQLKNSNVVTLMGMVAVAHRHATLQHDVWHFYREDVRDILSHPIIKMAFTSQVIALNNLIEELNEFNIPASTFVGTSLEPLFTSFHTSMMTIDDVKAFLTRLERFCETLFDATMQVERGSAPVAETEGDNNKSTKLPLQCAFIRQYVGVLRQLRVSINTIGLPVHDTTVFHLIDRMTSGCIVPFGGHSSEGIQVMGMLETRCLDFDDLRILSANDGIVPQRKNINSLIPNRFRAAFNLPTIDSIQATEAYRFYRLISRASQVTLYYDSSTDGKNEPSPYIDQLDKIYRCDITRIKRTATVNNVPVLDIAVPKEGLRLNVGEMYTQGEPTTERRVPCLSASSINEYINCPLKFYLHHLMKLSDDNNLSDFMDSSTFGTIVHDSLQELYYPEVAPGKERKSEFCADDIEKFIKNRLHDVLVRNINKTFMHRTAERLNDPLTGQAVIIYDALEHYAKSALKYDIQVMNGGTLQVVECEVEHFVKLDIGGTVVNFTFKADRIDRLGDTMRIIDYKTGGDPCKIASVGALFDNELPQRPKAILQLLLYAIAYMQINGNRLDGIKTITPMIYKLKSMGETGAFISVAPKKYAQIELPVDGFYDNDIVKDFIAFMRSKLDDLLSPDVKFVQAGINSSTCKYCHFTDFCRR